MVFSLFLAFLSCLKTSVKQDSSVKSLGIAYEVVSTGWLVTDVTPGSVSARKGLKSGDLILLIDGVDPIYEFNLRQKIIQGEELVLCVLHSETTLWRPNQEHCQGEKLVLNSTESVGISEATSALKEFENQNWERFQRLLLDSSEPGKVLQGLLNDQDLNTVLNAPISIGRYWAGLMSVFLEKEEIEAATSAARKLWNLHDERPYFLGSNRQLQQMLILLWNTGMKSEAIEHAYLRLERINSALPVLGMAAAPSAKKRRFKMPRHKEIELQLTTGEMWSLKENEGKPVLLNFFATWCLPCRYELPLLALEKERISGLEVLTVSSEDPKQIERHFKAMDIVLPVAKGSFDGIEPFKIPYTLLFDKDGSVVWRNEGFSERSFNRLRDELDSAVKNEGGVLFEEFFSEALFRVREFVPHAFGAGIAEKNGEVWIGGVDEAPKVLIPERDNQGAVGNLQPLYALHDWLIRVSGSLIFAYNKDSELVWVRNFSSPVQLTSNGIHTQNARFILNQDGNIHKESDVSPRELEQKRHILWEDSLETSLGKIRLVQLNDRLIAWRGGTMWVLVSQIPFQAQIISNKQNSELVLVFAQHGVVFFSPK
ncbi:MAG: hypothetical protein CMK59_10405 [Proteobacteria bacterium]|nr:hypothetical protein [Pseudomonadota bacterium]